MRLACSCSRNVRTSALILPLGARMNCVSSFCTISASEKWPSQSSRMTRPVPSTRVAPSGKRTTRASVGPPQRHPAANFGTLASVSSATLALTMLQFILNSKSARRRPARLYIGKIQRVEVCPEDVTLIPQCPDGALLLCAGCGVIEHVLQSEGSVFGRLPQARFKVVKPGREPWIVLPQFLHAQRNQIAREKFGQ